jgi:hypothetical protein
MYADQLEAEQAGWDFIYAPYFYGCLTEAEIRRIQLARAGGAGLLVGSIFALLWWFAR